MSGSCDREAQDRPVFDKHFKIRRCLVENRRAVFFVEISVILLLSYYFWTFVAFTIQSDQAASA